MYSTELSNVCKYMFLISSVVNFSSCAESVLLRMTFVVVPSAVGVPTLLGYLTFWPATVTLTRCFYSLFARMLHTKQGKVTFYLSERMLLV